MRTAALTVALVGASLVAGAGPTGAASAVVAAGGQVVIDARQSVGTQSKELFGGVFYPNRDHLAKLGPMLEDIGVTWVRVPVRPEAIVPHSSVNAYKAAMATNTGIADPATWNWGWAYAMQDATNRGMDTTLSLPYGGPAWLTYENDPLGVPKDWAVYRDIIAKIYRHFHAQTDVVNLINEPDVFVKIGGPGNPYPSKDAAVRDIFHHGTWAIRTVDPDVPNSFADENRGGGTWGVVDSLLADTRLADADLNVIDQHDYESSFIKNLDDLKKLASSRLRNPSRFRMSEWNKTWDTGAIDQDVIGNPGISYHGDKFIDYIRRGWTGAAYWALWPMDVLPDDIYSERPNTLGLYNWNNGSPTLLPWTRTWRVLSNKLAWGAGDGVAKTATRASGVTDAIGVVNSGGLMTAALVNRNTTARTIDLRFDNVAYGATPTASIYTASPDNDGSTATTVLATYAANTVALTVEVPAQSTVGVKLSGTVQVVPGTNLALGRPATADSATCPNGQASNAVDGQVATKWCTLSTNSSTTNHWLRVDLGAVKSITDYALVNASAQDAPWPGGSIDTSDFHVDASLDGSTWRTVDSEYLNQAATVERTLAEPINARYIRLRVTRPQQNETSPSVRVQEFRVFGSDDLNYAQDRPATAESATCTDPAAPAPNAVDGLWATKWCTRNPNGNNWLTVDLGSVRRVGRATVWHSGFEGETWAPHTSINTKDFSIQTSLNNTTWTTAATVSGNIADVSHLTFAPVDARYVRLLVTAAQTNPNFPAVRVQDLAVYGP